MRRYYILHTTYPERAYNMRTNFLLTYLLVFSFALPGFAQAGKVKVKATLAPDAGNIDKRPIGTIIDPNDRSLFVTRVDEQG
ncbi:MAG: hypothetical protein IPI91_03995, partial [Flavobacteriales bacterium]|nr:hypothetical protein [Flavobacteriales bacterium]